MIIYDKVKRFNPVTGDPVDKWMQKEIRCDYTGVVLDGDNMYCAYNLNYGDMDCCYGASGKEYQLGKDFKIDVFQFLCNPYYFLSVGGTDNKDENAEWAMMEEAMNNCQNPDSEWFRCYTFDAICRYARVRTAYELIESKEITPEQLNVP